MMMSPSLHKALALHKALNGALPGISGAMFAGAFALLCALPASADVLGIGDAAALRQAVAAGVTGHTLVLEPGTYDAIAFEEGTAPDAIRSADPDDPAVLLGLTASGFDGLEVENLILDYRFNAADPIHIRPFSFSDCSGLTVRGNRIVGDVARGRGPLDDGYGYGIGLIVSGCQHVLLEGNHISNFHRGLTVGGSRYVEVVGNELTAMRMDGMNFSTIRDILIEGNYIHDFNQSLDSPDHSDMIQFWTTNATSASRNIVIRGNILNSGHGYYTQSIFMRNELVDRGLAGREMFYNDILIEENVIINAHLHGITVGEAIGVTIRHNTLAQNASSITTGYPPDHTIWRPTIRVAETSSGVRVEDNLVWRVIGFDGQPGWRVDRNPQIQNLSLMQQGHYTQMFEGYPNGDPGAFESYFYRPGSPGAEGIGAALLRR